MLEIADVDGYTPLLCACWKGHKEVVQLLVSRGASLTTKDLTGKTAMSLACKEGHIAAAEFILRHSLDRGETEAISMVDNSGNTCLHYACQTGSLEIVDILLESSAAKFLLDRTNELNQSVLHVAASSGRAKCCAAIVEVRLPSCLL